MIFISGMAE